MNDLFSFFEADYYNGNVYINEKRYAAGVFAMHLLQQFYVNDTAARISVLIHSWEVQRELALGFLQAKEFTAAKEELVEILKNVGRLRPFDLFDIEKEERRLTELFDIDNAGRLQAFFLMRSQIEHKDPFVNGMGISVPGYDAVEFNSCRQLIRNISETLKFYESIGDGMRKAFYGLLRFIDRLEEAERFDEEHFLPIAKEELSGEIISKAQYVTITYRKKKITVRRLQFPDYYSFILTDFYEGLHYGHYPRQCPVCGKYFLMLNARRQYYCSGKAPKKLTDGKDLSCRKYAASCGVKELAEGNPVIAVYKRRMSYIRINKRRGIFDEDFAQAAKQYALELKETAILDDEYAKKQYLQDMQPKAFTRGVRQFMSAGGY